MRDRVTEKIADIEQKILRLRAMKSVLKAGGKLRRPRTFERKSEVATERRSSQVPMPARGNAQKA